MVSRRKVHWSLHVPHHGLLWLGRLFALLAMLVVGGISIGLWWLQQFHPQNNPVDLGSWVPQLEKLFGEGSTLKVGKLELFYNRGVVVRGSEVWLRGPDGALAVVIDDAAVRFSRTALVQLTLAPKSIEASNITLRLVRDAESISIAGLPMNRKEEEKISSKALGVIGWLNGLGGNTTWGWLTNVQVSGLTMLMRDDVQHTEWILQDANVDIGRGDDGGEHGSLVAEVRRISADGKERKLPVLVTFDHAPAADTAALRARFGRTDMDLIADYLPREVSKMMDAEGTVEVGTTLGRRNTFSQPWITLRLRDISFNLPQSDFSHGLKFSRLTLTASYQSSPTDLLTIHEVEGVYKGMEPIRGKGWVQGITGPDLQASIVLVSRGGDTQRVFDFLPDKRMDTAMPFLRQNIDDSKVANLVLAYNGHPRTLPYCGDACGLNLRGDIMKGTVRYADAGMPPVTGVSGSFALKGETLYFDIGPAKMGPHAVEGVKVDITKLFTEGPTDVIVTGSTSGPLPELLRGLGGWLGKPMPVVSAGTHETSVSVTVPFVRGKKTTPEDAKIIATSKMTDVALVSVPELPLPPVSVTEAGVRIADDRLSVTAAGKLGGQTIGASLADTLKDFGANLQGEVTWPAAKLTMNGDTLTLTGSKLDLSAFDLFETGDNKDNNTKNMNLVVKLDELITREATLSPLTAELAARGGRWEINTLTTKIEGKNQVNVVSSRRRDGRRKLAVNVDNTGQLLRAFGLYKDLRHGQLFGEINYDSPDVGAGVLEMRSFELMNPPVLVKLLGLLSLPQLIAGTDSTLFEKAHIPLRIDGDTIWLDNVTLEGPSMSLRLNGSYNRVAKQMNIDGQMAPAIPFNRLVGKIPLLGTLLTGGQDGVVVADFKLKGPSSDPEITVRPLSVITPGLLKGIFKGITGGGNNNPPPKPQVIDGRNRE